MPSSRAPWAAFLLSLLAALLLVPALVVPAQADGTDDPTPDPSTPAEVAEQALETVQEIIETPFTPADPASPTAAEVQGKDLTVALRDLAAAQKNLPKAKRAEAARLLARPDDSSNECLNVDQDLACYGAHPDKVKCNSVVCVHWVTTGPDAVDPENDGAGGKFPGSTSALPDIVEFTLATMNTVVSRFKDAGYRTPVRDGSAGGSSYFDVYLGQLGDDGAFGYCTVDDWSVTEHVPAPAYCVLDNDYAEFGLSPRSALRVTAAHEYFHAVQFAYDVNEDAWLMEATATWVEDEIYDSVNDNLNYLPYGSLARPQQSLDLFEDASAYGNWLFFRFLGERFPSTRAGLETVVRDIWSRTPDEYSVEAVRNVLAARSSSLPAQFAWFTVWNRRPASYYDEGAAYRPTPTRATYRLTGAAPKKVVSVRLDHLASSTYRFTRPSTGGTTWRLQLKFNLNDRVAGGAAVVTIKVKGHAPKAKVVALDTMGNATYSYPYGPSVEWVDVTPINASSRYTGCNDPDRDSTSTCQGVPVDDDETQTVSGLAYTG